ncbi:MAG TPA: xanthine dehydrogenase family protein subunit M [Candidatus Dormibacteraeota bacterium]|nr:xanthine dehydrogenase family protein subunit M [Candidatus Dormibacteraeota bacterium]
MIPAQFAYSRPASVDEAVRALAADPGAKLLAGGQSLLPLMKLRVASVERLVDIGRLDELRGVRPLPDGRLEVGALTTYRELLESPALMRYGLLRDAVPNIGDVQVRNRGTVGGAIAHADPASDLPAILLALEAEVVARSASGERTIPITSFFQGSFTSALRQDELITSVILPGGRDDAGSAYRSLEQPASGYSIVGVAAIVFVGVGGIRESRVAITGVGEIAYRAGAVEAALAGSDGSRSAVEAAAAHATDGIAVNADIHADAAYRAAMAVVYTRRALEAALSRVR